MTRRSATAWLTLVSLALLGCGASGVQWRNHTSFRASGADLGLALVDPREIITGRVSRNLHYVSIALDSVFFRNLPGLVPGRDVVLGLEIEGALPDGRVLRTVPEIARTTGASSFLSFDNVALLEPFLYTGRNITVTLYFRALRAPDAGEVRGRILGAGDLLKKLSPQTTQAIETAGQLFASVVGSTRASDLAWKYTFTLYPSDGVIRDKPDILFTATRHILLATPPPGAPQPFVRVKPRHYVQGLKLRGNRLVWKDTEEEYTLTPYLILNVTRFKRYPKPDTELRKLTSRLAVHFENGSFDQAKAILPEIGAAIARDPVITSTEKNLERSWKDFWEARIEGALAAKRGEGPLEVDHLLKQMRVLLKIKEQFRSILEPFETKDIAYQLSTLKDRYDERTKAGGAPFPPELAQALTEDRRRDVAAAEKEKEEADRVLKRFATAAVEVNAAPFLTALPRQIDSVARDGIHRKWWFWTLVGAVVVGGAAAAYLGARGGEAGGIVLGR
jgi:hypothetical protein